MSSERFARASLIQGGEPFFARVEGDEIVKLDGAPWLGGAPIHRLPSSETRLHVPTIPSKILCVGRNYRAHAKELGNDVPAEPMLFFKPPSSLLDPGGTIQLPDPSISSRVEHEAELGVVIGARVRDASEEDARRAIFGLTIVCDVTARDLQKKDCQWWRAKGMDTFCPVGPHLVTGLDASALTIECRVNGVRRQHGSTADMIFSVIDVIRFVSRVMTLEPGDLLATGTPEGVGPLLSGDDLEVEIKPIGTLRARVAAHNV
jgi:2-keto-4-pentenoate hydratase/2-oxohepta-3-ene-1,7-dioic acid hydratase in catechol pathway